MTDGTKELLTKLGNNIKMIREKRNLTQLDIQHLTGIYAADLSRIEKGRVNLSFTKLIRLSKALGVQLNELYNIKKEMET